jgi:hypothetical protein
MRAILMDLSEFIFLLLFWTMLLAGLSGVMLRSREPMRSRYSEIMGCLILLALFTLMMAAFSAVGLAA